MQEISASIKSLDFLCNSDMRVSCQDYQSLLLELQRLRSGRAALQDEGNASSLVIKLQNLEELISALRINNYELKDKRDELGERKAQLQNRIQELCDQVELKKTKLSKQAIELAAYRAKCDETVNEFSQIQLDMMQTAEETIIEQQRLTQTRKALGFEKRRMSELSWLGRQSVITSARKSRTKSVSGWGLDFASRLEVSHNIRVRLTQPQNRIVVAGDQTESLFAVSNGKGFTLFDYSDGRQLKMQSEGRILADSLVSLVFANQLGLLVAGTQVYSPETGFEWKIEMFKQDRSATVVHLSSIPIPAEPRVLASGSQLPLLVVEPEGRLRLFDLVTQKASSELVLPEKEISSVATTSRCFFFCASDQGSLWRVDTRSHHRCHLLEHPTRAKVFHMQEFDDHYLAVGIVNTEVGVIDERMWRTCKSVQLPASASAPVFSVCNERLCFGSQDGQVEVFDLSSTPKWERPPIKCSTSAIPVVMSGFNTESLVAVDSSGSCFLIAKIFD